MARVGKGRISRTKSKEPQSKGTDEGKETGVKEPEVKATVAARDAGVSCLRCGEGMDKKIGDGIDSPACQ